MSVISIKQRTKFTDRQRLKKNTSMIIISVIRRYLWFVEYFYDHHSSVILGYLWFVEYFYDHHLSVILGYLWFVEYFYDHHISHPRILVICRILLWSSFISNPRILVITLLNSQKLIKNHISVILGYLWFVEGHEEDSGDCSNSPDGHDH